MCRTVVFRLSNAESLCTTKSGNWALFTTELRWLAISSGPGRFHYLGVMRRVTGLPEFSAKGSETLPSAPLLVGRREEGKEREREACNYIP